MGCGALRTSPDPKIEAFRIPMGPFSFAAARQWPIKAKGFRSWPGPANRLNRAETRDPLTLTRLRATTAARLPGERPHEQPRNDCGDRQRAPRRRSLWLTAVFGVLAVIVLDLAFSQSTLTAPMPDTVDMADMTWVEIRSAIDAVTQ